MIKINLTMPMNPRMFQISPPRIKINLEKLIRLGEVVVVMGKNQDSKPWNKHDRAPSPYAKKDKGKQAANNVQSTSKEKPT